MAPLLQLCGEKQELSGDATHERNTANCLEVMGARPDPDKTVKGGAKLATGLRDNINGGVAQRSGKGETQESREWAKHKGALLTLHLRK